MKCGAKGCVNDTSEGIFYGKFCMPCVRALESGVAEHGTSWIFTQQAALHALVDCVHMPEPHLDAESNPVHLCVCCAEVMKIGGIHSDDCHVFAAEKALSPWEHPTENTSAGVKIE